MNPFCVRPITVWLLPSSVAARQLFLAFKWQIKALINTHSPRETAVEEAEVNYPRQLCPSGQR